MLRWVTVSCPPLSAKRGWTNVKRFFPREMALDVLNNKWIKQTSSIIEQREGVTRDAAAAATRGVVCLCRMWWRLSKRLNNAAVQSSKTWLSVAITVSMSPAGIDSDCCTCHASRNERLKCHSTAEQCRPYSTASDFHQTILFFTKQFWTLHLLPSRLIQVVAFPTFIPEVPTSNFGRNSVVIEAFVVLLSPSTNTAL